MNKFKLFLMSALFMLSTTIANAGLLELRGGIGMQAANPDEFEDQLHSVNNNGLSSDDFQTYNVDLMFNIPVSPINVGLRHEWLNQDDSSNGSSLDLEVRNLALLVDWRIIDTGIYVGPIVSVGSPSADIDFKSGTTNISGNLDADELSYSAGLEAGVILGHFIVGAETGYQSLKLEQKTNSSGVNANIDLSGFYGKAMVGLTFL